MDNAFVFKLMDDHAPLTDEQLKTATIEDVVLHNLRFAYTQAKLAASKYPGLSDDEVLEGMFYAATLAANKWDRTQSKITSYMAPWIRTVIKEMANNNKHAIGRNTMHIWKSHVINTYIEGFKSKHDRLPTNKEVSEGVLAETGHNFSEKTVYNISNLGIKSVSSFNVTTSDQDSEHDLNEVISDPDAKTPYDDANANDLSFIMDRLIAGLSDLERSVIQMYWYENRKYKDIAADLDIPHTKVKKLEVQAMNKLKSELNAIEKTEAGLRA